jgi:hypothetical protein
MTTWVAGAPQYPSSTFTKHLLSGHRKLPFRQRSRLMPFFGMISDRRRRVVPTRHPPLTFEEFLDPANFPQVSLVSLRALNATQEYLNKFILFSSRFPSIPTHSLSLHTTLNKVIMKFASTLLGAALVAQSASAHCETLPFSHDIALY